MILSPFAGIGSEGVGAIKLKRKFVGIEPEGELFPAGGKISCGSGAGKLNARPDRHDGLNLSLPFNLCYGSEWGGLRP